MWRAALIQQIPYPAKKDEFRALRQWSVKRAFVIEQSALHSPQGIASTPYPDTRRAGRSAHRAQPAMRPVAGCGEQAAQPPPDSGFMIICAVWDAAPRCASNAARSVILAARWRARSGSPIRAATVGAGSPRLRLIAIWTCRQRRGSYRDRHDRTGLSSLSRLPNMEGPASRSRRDGGRDRRIRCRGSSCAARAPSRRAARARQHAMMPLVAATSMPVAAGGERYGLVDDGPWA